jgi:hypothetical protein
MHPAPPNAELTTDRLALLVSQRRRCLLQLRDLSGRQSALIDAGDMVGLMPLISAKSQLIEALRKIEQGLAPFQAQDPEQRAWPTAAAREACAADAEAGRALLQEVMAAERANERRMTDRRDEVAFQLQRLVDATHVRRSYEAHQHSGAAR